MSNWRQEGVCLYICNRCTKTRKVYIQIIKLTDGYVWWEASENNQPFSDLSFLCLYFDLVFVTSTLLTVIAIDLPNEILSCLFTISTARLYPFWSPLFNHLYVWYLYVMEGWKVSNRNRWNLCRKTPSMMNCCIH